MPIKRRTPYPEWVLMYRRGIPIAKIAAVTHVAESVIRRHITIACKQEPGLRAEHQAAQPPAPPRVTGPGMRNAEDILAFYQAAGRLPVTGRSKQESALAGWLARRRKQATDGTLSPAYSQALDTLPGWRDYSTKWDADAARWKQRLAEIAAYLAGGHDWPRHNKTDDQEELTLGVWLHTQRIDYRARKLPQPRRSSSTRSFLAGGRAGRGGERTAGQMVSRRDDRILDKHGRPIQRLDRLQPLHGLRPDGRLRGPLGEVDR